MKNERQKFFSTPYNRKKQSTAALLVKKGIKKL